MQNRTVLKSYFKKGAIPTESQFAELVESTLNQTDDGVFKAPGGPLSIRAVGAEEGAVDLYGATAGDAPAWQLRLRPSGAQKPGLSFHDAAGSRLFIENGTGYVGVGTSTPGARLQVAGGFKAESLDSGERPLLLEVPAGGNHRGNDANLKATGLVLRVRDNPGSGEPIFQVRSGGQAVRFFVEHDGWTGSKDNAAWFGGGRSSYFGGSVGVGVQAPVAQLQVGELVANRADYDFSGTALMVRSKTANTAGGPESALALVREGVNGQSYANLADFRIGRSPDGGTRLSLHLAKQGFAIQEVMRVDAEGRVAIGAADPKASLDVRGSLNTQVLSFADGAGEPYPNNWIGKADNIEGSLKWLHIGGITDGDGDKRKRRISMQAGITHFAGNVGVGVTSPAAALDVNGKVKSKNVRSVVAQNNPVNTDQKSYVDLPDMTMRVTCPGWVLVLFKMGGCQTNRASTDARVQARAYFQLLVGGETRAVACHEFNNNGWELRDITLQWCGELPAGEKEIKVQWRVDTDTKLTGCWYQDTRSLICIEL